MKTLSKAELKINSLSKHVKLIRKITHIFTNAKTNMYTNARYWFQYVMIFKLKA